MQHLQCCDKRRVKLQYSDEPGEDKISTLKVSNLPLTLFASVITLLIKSDLK